MVFVVVIVEMRKILSVQNVIASKESYYVLKNVVVTMNYVIIKEKKN